MSSEVLKLSSGFLRLVFGLLSVIILLRGHNLPGGGFIGGIILAAGFVLHGLAYGYEKFINSLAFRPHIMLMAGLIVAFAAAIIGLMTGKTFFEGLWINLKVINFKIGTPLLFDIGVYLTVFGVILTIFSYVMEELKWK